MTNEPTEREKDLARRVAELETQLGRPKLSGGGVIADTANLILGKVPKTVLTVAAFLVLGYTGFTFFFSGQILRAETERLQAEAATKGAEFEAAGGHLGSTTIETEKLRAKIDATLAEAAKLRADASAQGSTDNGKTMRLRTLGAEIANAQAEAARIDADVGAMTQIVDGTTEMAVAQKRAEVEASEQEASRLLAETQYAVSLARKYVRETNDPNSMWHNH